MKFLNLRKLAILTLNCVVLSGITNGQQIKSEAYVINGSIAGIDFGLVKMLSRNGSKVLDSARVVKGKFYMKGNISTPERLLFNISPGNWNFMAFVENSTIDLLIDTTGAEYYSMNGDHWALIWEINETGSDLSDVYKIYKEETNFKYYTSIFRTLHKKLKTEEGNKDTAFSLKQEMDSINTLLLSSQKKWIENYIDLNPSSIGGVYLFSDYYQSAPDISMAYLDFILNKFSGLAKTSVYYKQLTNTAIKLKNRQSNNLAPNFTLLQRDKSVFTLSSTKGNYTLIDFWASWCVPCRQAIPFWKKVHTKYKDKGFIIVSVADDRIRENWIKALNKEQMPWVQVIDEFPSANEPALVADMFEIDSLPFYVLLDREGRVLLSSSEKDTIEKKIESIFQ